MDLISRHAESLGRDMLGAFPAVVISGARQVGKSTLAGRLVRNIPHLAVTLDDESTRAAAQADSRAFVEQFTESTLVIDEVQRYPELLLAIKASIDRNRRAGRFLLTGSADLLNVKGQTDSLAGRAVTLNLRGFSQGELAGRIDDFVAMAASGERFTSTTTWARPDYARALASGGYPEIQRMPDRMRTVWIDSYIDRILTRDAVSLPSGGRASRIRTVLGLLAANQAGELVKSRVAEQARIPANSIDAYLDVLRSVYLVDLLPPWTPNLTKREVGRPKAFVTDPALALRLTRQTASQLEDLASDTIGSHLEAFVAGELLKQQAWSTEEFTLFHFRDRNGVEVDLVLELGDSRVIGVEVKASSTYRTEHFKGLRALQDKVGDRFIAGYVLGMGERRFDFAPGLYGLPVSALWEWH